MTNEKNQLVELIDAITADMEGRILPGCDHIMQEDIFGIIQSEFENVIQELSNHPSSSETFVAVHVIHAMVHTMLVDHRVTIEDPAGFYRTAMKALIVELNHMKEDIIRGESECDTCSDKATCSEDRARQAKGASPWGTRNVH